MKNKCLFVVVLLFAFVLFGSSTRTSSAGYVLPLNQKEKQTSDTTVCTDVVEKLQQDRVMVDIARIDIDKNGKILFLVKEPAKYDKGTVRSLVSFKRFVELRHKNHRILQVQFNFNALDPKAYIFHEELPEK